MMEELLSVGIDLGTTTTQMVVSKLGIENTASAFSVPQMEIRQRKVLYRSSVYFTPLLSKDTLDAAAIAEIIQNEYQKAGIRPEQVQTGAVIITGETARKENAREVLRNLSGLAGDFVVATAGPALESVLAAKGAGAEQYAKERSCSVLHIDIGGGTSNYALFDADGKLVDTGCVNVGGRLIKLDPSGTVTYVSPVLSGIPCPKVGETVGKDDLETLLQTLVQILEEAAGLRPATALSKRFITDRIIPMERKADCISFSGGVADLLETEADWLQYGDLGVLLGKAIRNSQLCAGQYRIGTETLRATVIGAGIHTTELSGSTVFCNKVQFPIQNRPVVEICVGEAFGEVLSANVKLYEQIPVVALKGPVSSYDDVAKLADEIAAAFSGNGDTPMLVAESDYAKALGHAVSRRLGADRSLLCLDGLRVTQGCYLDIQAPIGDGKAVPVIIKTLAFQ